MIPDPHLIERLIGAVSGGILALIFLLPKTWSGFFRRAFSSLIGGVVFATPLREWIEWPMTSEYVIASGTLAGFVTWWGMGAVSAAAEKFGISLPKSGKRNQQED